MLFDIDNLDTNEAMIQLAKSKNINWLIDNADGVCFTNWRGRDSFECGVWLGQLIEKAKARKVWVIKYDKSHELYFIGSYKNVMTRINELLDE